MAKVPVPQYYRKVYQDFSGGLNNLQNPLVIPENEFSQLDNAVINSTGILEKSNGYALDALVFPDDADSFIRMLVNFKRGTSVDKLVVAALDEGNANATYKVDLKETSGTGTYDYIGYAEGTATFTSTSATVEGQAGTQWATHLKAGDKIKPSGTSVWYEIQSVTDADTLVLTTVFAEATQTTSTYKARIILNKDFIPQSAVFNNKLVITNGSDTPMSYDNTSVTLITDAQAPKGKFIETHKNRVFIAATSGSPSTVYWSHVNDETAWEAESAEPIFPQDNGNICAIKSFADSLIVLKDNGKIYQLLGSFDESEEGSPSFISKIDTPDNIGTIAGFTACIHDDGRLYFLSETGMYALDQRLAFEKVSWNVEENLSNVILQPGAITSKAYTYDTESEWDDGTFDGTYVDAGGTLYNHYGLLRITDAGQTLNPSTHAVAIGTDDTVHIVYRSASNTHVIKYIKWEVDGTQTVETVYTDNNAVQGISIALNGSTVGVLFGTAASPDEPKLKYTERTSSWSAPTTVYENTGSLAVYCCSFVFLGSDIRAAIWATAAGSTFSLLYAKRVSGTWSTGTIAATISSFTAASVAIALNASNNPRVMGFNGSTMYAYYSDDDMANWTGFTSVGSVTAAVGIQIASTGKAYSLFSDAATTVKKRNWTDSATTTVDSTTSSYPIGYKILSDLDYWYNVHGTSSATEKYGFAGSSSVSSSADGPKVLTGYYPNNQGNFVSNSKTFATLTLGGNANELLVRRIAFNGTYISAEHSDSTLSAWGTYDVSDEVTGGNTVLYQVALNTISPPSSYVTITNGSVISSDPAKIYAKTKVTITLGAFAQSAVGSIVLNYTGTGVGPTIPTAVVFDNEIYLSIAETGEDNNTKVMFLDRDSAWSTKPYPVIFMARYKGLLYAGSATNGKVYKLNTGFDLNGSAYTVTAVTKEDLLGSLELQKEISKIYVIYETKPSGTFTFSYKTDSFINSANAWVDTTVQQANNGIAEIKYIGSPFRSIKFKIESSSTGVGIGIIGFVIVYGYLELR